jgi:hypothetical protein
MTKQPPAVSNLGARDGKTTQSIALAILALFLLGLVFSSSTVEAADLTKHLATRVIDAQLPLKEVQRFCDARVPRMPKVSTRAEWQAFANRTRKDVLDNVVFQGSASQWRDEKLVVERLETIEGGPEYVIHKLRYLAAPGMWIPALMYEPKKLTGKVPVMLNVNGHDSKNGKAAEYKQKRCINQAKRGMIALNVEWLGMGQLNVEGNSHYRMNQLDLCGTNGMAPFYLSMSRGLDVLLAHKHADPSRVGVAGLSGGGWQTIFISSLDTRVTLCDPVAGYSSFLTRSQYFSDLGDSEQTPNDLAKYADYTHLTAMLAPRASLLTFNAKDNCCFASPHALPPLLNAATPIFRLYGKTDHLKWHVNHDPGNHNFGLDNRQALYRMLGDFFFADAKNFNAKEIECDKEVKSFKELTVKIPKNNATFHSLAVAEMKNLPTEKLPSEGPAYKKWQSATRKALRKSIVAKSYKVTAQSKDKITLDSGVSVQSHALKLGSEWTVPCTEFAPKDAKSTTIVLADGGRKSIPSETINSLLADGQRVLAIDPFYFGESKISQRDFLFALLVATVGERPIGIQANQINAIAKWARSEFGTKTVNVSSIGPRTSLMSRVAAGCDTQISACHTKDEFTSLRAVIEQDLTVNKQPELFCFGLLKTCDISHLKHLAK